MNRSPFSSNVPTPSDWRSDGLCRNADPELFFPIGSSAAAQAQELEAKAICSVCPSMMKCREWAQSVSLPKIEGIWGGQTQVERERLQRRQRRSAAANAS